VGNSDPVGTAGERRGLCSVEDSDRDAMAEVHILGEIHGATGFDGKNVFCKVRV